MAVTASWFSHAGIHLAKGEIAFVDDEIKVLLMTNSYTPDATGQETYDDIKATEVANGNGYTTRGVALGTKSVEYDDDSNKALYVAANAVWTPGSGQTLTGHYGVIYKDSGTDNTSWLMGYCDFGADISAIGAPLTINWDTDDGILWLGLPTE